MTLGHGTSLHRHGDKSQVALGILQSQQHRVAARCPHSLDALDDILYRIDLLLGSLDDDIADLDVSFRRRAGGVYLEHDNPAHGVAEAELGAQLIGEGRQNQAYERASGRALWLDAAVLLLAFAPALRRHTDAGFGSRLGVFGKPAHGDLERPSLALACDL